MVAQNSINAPTNSAGWTAFTTNVTASTNPGKGTIVHDLSYYLQVGKILYISWQFQSTGGSVGSGTYSFSIPAGFTIDIAKTGTFNQTTTDFLPCIGTGSVANSTSNGTSVVLAVNTTTNYVCWVPVDTTFVSNAVFGLGQTPGNSYNWNLTIPIL